MTLIRPFQLQTDTLKGLISEIRCVASCCFLLLVCTNVVVSEPIDGTGLRDQANRQLLHLPPLDQVSPGEVHFRSARLAKGCSCVIDAVLMHLGICLNSQQ